MRRIRDISDVSSGGFEVVGRHAVQEFLEFLDFVLAHCAGVVAPEWATAPLVELVKVMDESKDREARIEHAVLDAVECAVLARHIGERFDATVIDENEHGVVVQIPSPAVVARLGAHRPLGSRVRVAVEAVDPVARRVDLAPSPS